MTYAAAIPEERCAPAFAISTPPMYQGVGALPRAIASMVMKSTAPMPSLKSDSPASWLHASDCRSTKRLKNSDRVGGRDERAKDEAFHPRQPGAAEHVHEQRHQ